MTDVKAVEAIRFFWMRKYNSLMSWKAEVTNIWLLFINGDSFGFLQNFFRRRSYFLETTSILIAHNGCRRKGARVKIEASHMVLLMCFSTNTRLFVCLFLFHLYPPVTRKRRWRYMLDESAPA